MKHIQSSPGLSNEVDNIEPLSLQEVYELALASRGTVNEESYTLYYVWLFKSTKAPSEVDSEDIEKFYTLGVLEGMLSYIAPIDFSLVELFLSDASKNGFIKEVMIRNMEAVDFSTVKLFLQNNNIDLGIRETLALYITPVDFLEVIDFLTDHEVNIRVRTNLIHSCNPVSFLLIKDFIYDSHIELGLKKNLLEKVVEVRFADMVELLECDLCDDILIAMLAKELESVDFKEVKRLLFSEETSIDFKDKLSVLVGDMKFVNKISLTDALVFLENEDFKYLGSVGIIKNMELINPQEMKMLLENEAISDWVKIYIPSIILSEDVSFQKIDSCLRDQQMDNLFILGLINNMEVVTFSDIRNLLENTELKIGIDIKEKLIEKMKEVTFVEVESLLGNDAISPGVKKAVIEKVSSIEFSELQGFLKKYEILPSLLKKYKIQSNLVKNLVSKTVVPGYSGDILQSLKNVSPSEKLTTLVNKYQADLLLPEKNVVIPEVRTLVLYVRESQGAYMPHIEQMAPILENYVKYYSKVWNNFKIVTRFGEKKNVAGKECGHPRKQNFESETNIFADTIHLSHGTVNSGIVGTHPIVGTTTLVDPNKMNGVEEGNYTPLDLVYIAGDSLSLFNVYVEDCVSVFDFERQTGVPDKSIDEVVETLIFSLQEAEDKIIAKLPLSISASEQLEENKNIIDAII